MKIAIMRVELLVHSDTRSDDLVSVTHLKVAELKPGNVNLNYLHPQIKDAVEVSNVDVKFVEFEQAQIYAEGEVMDLGPPIKWTEVYEEDTQVSGDIYATKDNASREGEIYTIRTRSGASWGLPVEELEPEDLRALADRIEAARA